MNYPEIINLPFNRQSLPAGFTLKPEPFAADTDNAHWVILQGSSVLLQQNADQLSLPVGRIPINLNSTRPPLAFALWNEKPVLAVTITATQPLPDGLIVEPFNAFQQRVPTDIMSVAGLGKQLLHADQATRYCPKCGTATKLLAESWGKICPNCRHESYPPLHPCAIVLIRHKNRLLLVRKPEWAEGRYSLVAGFMEVGESLEECAIREAREETGVTIRNVRYIASQAWPFPSQLMVGFIAEYSHGEIAVDGKEIADARWFDLDNLPDMPSRRSIARFLIDSCAA